MILRFPSGQEWCAANWVFRRLRADIPAHYAGRPELMFEFDKAEAFGMLDHTYLPAGLEGDVWAALRAAVETSGADESGYGDSIRDLHRLLRADAAD